MPRTESMCCAGRRFTLGAIVAALFSTSPVTAQVFNYLDPVQDVSPAGTNAWVDVDCSTWVPAGATGVIVQAYNESSSDLEYGVRKKGSTDTWMEGLTLQEDTASYFVVGVDANQTFQVWQDNSVIITYLVGYTTAGVTLFTNAIDKSLTTTGSWQDIDISGDTGAETAIGAIFIMRSTTTASDSYAVRKKGSTDDRYKDLRANMSTGVMIGVDASEVFQLRIQNTAIDTYLMGYVTAGAVFLTNAVDKSIAATSVYTDIDISAQIGTDDATGAFVEWITGDDRDLVATRTNGSSHDVYEFSSHQHSFIGVDVNNVFEGKIQNTSCDFYLVGYSTSGSGSGPGTGYAVGNAGTIIKTTDGGTNWSAQTSGTTENLRGVWFPIDDTTGYVTGFGGKILKTVDGGANWSSQTSGTTLMLLSVDFPTDATTGYVVGESGTILKTTDGGSNWSSQTSGTVQELRGVTFPVDATTGYAVGKNEVILKTTDGGSNWVTQSSGSGPNYRGVCFPVDATTGYVVGNDGIILKTTDGGSNWNAQTSGTTEHLFAVSFPVDATTGYVVGNDGFILKTTDGGSNWVTQASGTGEFHRGVHFPTDATTGFCSGNGGRILKTTDGGSTWNPLTTGTTEELRGMHFPVPVTPPIYRSIGTNSGIVHNAGTATITSGTSTVTFTGTSLPTNVGQGDELVVGGETLWVLSRDSATQMTVQQAASSTHTNAVYTLRRAYNTLQAWENDRDGDLVGEDRNEVGVCYNDGPFTTRLAINDSTTDADHYMTLTVAEGQRHDGTAGTGARLDAGGGWGMRPIDVKDQYTRVEWLEITNWLDDQSGVYFDEDPAYDNADNSTASNLLLHNFFSGTSDAAIMVRADNITVRNVVIFDGDSEGIRVRAGSGAVIENCTVYGIIGEGIRQIVGTAATFRNNISVGNTIEDFFLEGTVDYFDHNMYTNTAGGFTTGANDQSPPADLDDLFMTITAGSEDLHLEATGHNAIDTGVDVAGFTIDIDGETRLAGSWDIGADEMKVTANYRSIGTQAGTLYDAGDATIAAGSRTVTFGGGASLPTTVGLGDTLAIGAETLYILSRDSTTQVTLQTAAAGVHSGAAYTITRAYNTFAAWETDRSGDLVAEERREIGVAYNDGPFTPSAPVVIGGSVTDATHYMKITVAEGQRHDGTAGTGARITGLLDDIFKIEDEYTVIEWLEISDYGGTNHEAITIDDSPSGNYSLVQNLLIHDYTQKCAILINGIGTVRNCIMYNGYKGIYVWSASGTGDATIENCTIWNMVQEGIDVDAAGSNRATVRNTIVVGSGTVDLELFGAGDIAEYCMYQTYNGTDPATIGGNHQSPPADLDDLFFSIAASSENLHLEGGGHNAADTGLDLSASFTVDIDGVVRAAPWEIGADEINASPLLVSSGSSQTFTVGDPATAISGITITDHGQTPMITAAGDLRITIPATTNMTWDIFDTLASISGTGAGKVASAVSYENGDKTLVLDVTSDFAAQESVTVADLSFDNFSAQSSADSLTLDVNNDATADATDDKTVTINPGAGGSSGTKLISWVEVPPSGGSGAPPAPVITFDAVTTDITSVPRSTASFSHTIAGACTCCGDPLLVVITMSRGDQEATSVTYGGQGMQLAVSERAASDSGAEWVKIWYLANPPTGANTVQADFSISEDPNAVVALSYYGVDSSDPIGAVAGNSSTSSSSTVSVTISTTTENSFVVGGLGHHGGDTDPHDVGGDVTTEHFDLVSGGATSSDSGYAGGEIAATTSGLYTFEWTGNVSDDYAIACIELKPAP